MSAILDVNLSNGMIKEFEINGSETKKFIGGKGYAAKLLYESLEPKIDPLSEKNMLIFMTGPLSGTPAPSSGRFCCSTKSPLTCTIFDSHCGGHFAHELRRAGFDGIIIRGRANDKVFLNINDGEAEILDASKLWGRGTRETEALAKAKIKNDKAGVLCIGAAGENLVRFASIIHEGHRALGRGGLGAVMGSKNLKAIAADGKQKIPISEEAQFRNIIRKAFELLKAHPTTSKTLPRYGTPNIVSVLNKVGLLPTRNFQTGYFESAEKISGEELSKYVTKHYGCFGCSIRCSKFARIDGVETSSLEYETIYAFGSNCGSANLKLIAKANELCNNFGMDTISTGATIAFLIEAAEKGSVEHKIEWGSEDIIALVEKIALRHGVGGVLAEGSRRAAQKFGADFAMQVKGLELAGYDPRGAVGLSLGYATGNEGASHMRSPVYIDEILVQRIDRLETKGKAALVKSLQDHHAALDSLILCKFVDRALNAEIYASLLSAATGIEFSQEDLQKAGERIFNLERQFNLREGFARSEDTLPARLLKEPIPNGNSRGQVVGLEILDEYYALRGWSAEGAPTKEKLAELGL